MPTTAFAPADPALRGHALALVRRYAALALEESRRFVARARVLVDLDACADVLDPVFGQAVWSAEAGLATGVSEASVRSRTARSRRLLALPALVSALEAGAVGVPLAERLLEVLCSLPDGRAATVAARVLAPLAEEPGRSPLPCAARRQGAAALVRPRRRGGSSRAPGRPD